MRRVHSIDVLSQKADGGAGVMTQGKEFKGRQFTAEVILWAMRWYLMFPISYRDLELMLQDRGVWVDNTTLFRWTQPMPRNWRSGSTAPARAMARAVR